MVIEESIAKRNRSWWSSCHCPPKRSACPQRPRRPRRKLKAVAPFCVCKLTLGGLLMTEGRLRVRRVIDNSSWPHSMVTSELGKTPRETEAFPERST